MTDYDWFPGALAFMDLYGIPREVVQAAADQPTVVTKNEDSGKDGWDIQDRRRGDVTAIVGMKPDVPEAIMYVRIFTGEDSRGGSRQPSGATDAPKTMRGLRARIIDAGYSIHAGRTHDKVLNPDGQPVMGLPTTPSDKRAVPNSWAEFRRIRDKRAVAERVARGNLLDER